MNKKPKFCVDCVHASQTIRPDFYRCKRMCTYNIVTGEKTHVSCDAERLPVEGYCGPDAKYFETKKDVK